MFHHKKIQVYRNLDGLATSPHEGNIPMDMMESEKFRRAVENTAAKSLLFLGLDLEALTKESLERWNMQRRILERQRDTRIKLAENVLGKPYPRESIAEKLRGLLSD